MPENSEIVVVVKRVFWAKDDGSFAITLVEPLPEDQLPDPPPTNDGKDGPVILGTPPDGRFMPGVKYTIRGYWKTKEGRGLQFNFSSAVEKAAATRHGVVEYLRKNAAFIGDATAHAIVDKFGEEGAINKLKSDPDAVAEAVRGLTPARARRAAEELKEVQGSQETTVRMLELLSKKGFGQKAIEHCIKKWGVHAPDVVKRDPFKLMTAGIFGAGFLRCDQLWLGMGLPPDRMRRQVMAAWNHLRTDSSGSTWHNKEHVIRSVRNLVTGRARPDRAVAIAIRAGLFEQCERDGKLWLAERKKANDERHLADLILSLMEHKDDPDSTSEASTEAIVSHASSDDQPGWRGTLDDV